MNFPNRFIAATTAYSTLTEFVPAPYLRKSFTLENTPKSANIIICGLGFYELYINGKRITKGNLAPYISNPDDIVYYDQYDIKSSLVKGENVIGLWLGNGLQNNPGGFTWDFEKGKWRGAPKVALRCNIDDNLIIESDETFKTAPSPVYNDDYRNGEYYDARNELPGWNLPGFNDAGWKPAILAPMPRGEARVCEADPIVVTHEIKPVSITSLDDGYLYDFGVNCAGICRLTIKGDTGQMISLYHSDRLYNGRIEMRGISFCDNDYVQKDIYICNGKGIETYTPSFTYHGFRYVFAKGLTSAQAVAETLTYLVMNSQLKERGSFVCSDETINKLQEITIRTALANFHYFPTDCPHREKNGWTADAALSAEFILLNLNPENSYREWMRNIYKAQADDGGLPGIVPTAGWGFDVPGARSWTGSTDRVAGPAWDNVIVTIPYLVYMYRGDKSILKESSHAIFRYLDFLSSKIRDDGLISFGIGDWCPTARENWNHKTPVHFTDTVCSMDICEKAAFIFGELDMPIHQGFAISLYEKLRTAAREKLLNLSTMTTESRTQTSQAMAIFYNVFDPHEEEAAFNVLLEIIKEENDHFNMGVLGARVLFHVLAQFGKIDLALKLITQKTFPSYGWWLEQGATSIWEKFDEGSVHTNGICSTSFSHPFWGDISHFFIRHLAGIHYNPRCNGQEVDIRPQFPSNMSNAQGYYLAPQGEIRVRWEQELLGYLLTVKIPESMAGFISLPDGMAFEDGSYTKPAASGDYRVT